MPKVTVLMAVHNGERFIAGAISSVLNQTFTDFELLVVDDASTDQTASIVHGCQDRRIRYVATDRNRGLAGSLNLGLRQASGAFIARLDHDDVSRPDRLARQIEILDAEPSIAVVGSLARLIDASGRDQGLVERPVSKAGIRWMSLLENPLIHSAVMFRASVARELDGYREDMPFAEDFDLWTRMIERHDAHNIGEPLIDYRQSSGSIMSAIGRDDRAGVELRRSHAAIITRRLESELRRTCEPAEANLLAGVVAGLAPSEIARFLSSYDAITEAFEQRLAEATATPDYWRTRARQLDAVAHRLNPPSRLGAARVYLHSLRRNPGLATHVSWPRLAAATVLGRRGRDRARAAIEAVH